MSNIMVINPSVQLDTIETAVAAIKTRGAFVRYYLLNPGGSYVDLVNVTGSGKLVYLMTRCTGSGAGMIQFIIDGVVSAGVTVAVTQDISYISLRPPNLDTMEPVKSAENEMMNLEFNTSLVIEVLNSADAVHFHAMCQID